MPDPESQTPNPKSQTLDPKPWDSNSPNPNQQEAEDFVNSDGNLTWRAPLETLEHEIEKLSSLEAQMKALAAMLGGGGGAEGGKEEAGKKKRAKREEGTRKPTANKAEGAKEKAKEGATRKKEVKKKKGGRVAGWSATMKKLEFGKALVSGGISSLNKPAKGGGESSSKGLIDGEEEGEAQGESDKVRLVSSTAHACAHDRVLTRLAYACPRGQGEGERQG